MRNIALAVLMEVMEDGAYANIALRKALGQANLEPRDRAFVTELVNETLRNMGYLDAVINFFASLPVDKMRPYIRNLLCMSVCQMRILTKVPPHAAVHEAVELAKSSGNGTLAGFINGVLRNINRRPDEPVLSDTSWAVKYSCPPRLAAHLTRWLGEDAAREFARYSHAAPLVTIYANTTKITSAALAEKLTTHGMTVTPLEGAFLALRNTGDISVTEAFQAGEFFVMDPGAMAVVDALQLQPAQTMLDLCAAPGGKSFAAACATGGSAIITAMDIHPHRVTLMEMTRKRLGLQNITTRVGDATVPATPLATTENVQPMLYDAVLLDAPCSGLGTLRKRPEIKLRYNGIDPTLPDLQRKLLTAAATHVAPGGILVYATCTVTLEENAQQVASFCAAHPGFSLEHEAQLLPGAHSDGFYIARLRKMT
ncbi:MAG: 16S rRNA (cytosine(967)-C(5))-methyltransferase RsmB [Defluviitaleaceae bacterium]|nr:16S rRNA (cytosine(967)-C(5))-methyltransferase RsmB [Defluviitaleaceae bacterium]